MNFGISFGADVMKQALSKSYGVLNDMNLDLSSVTKILATPNPASSFSTIPIDEPKK